MSKEKLQAKLTGGCDVFVAEIHITKQHVPGDSIRDQTLSPNVGLVTTNLSKRSRSLHHPQKSHFESPGAACFLDVFAECLLLFWSCSVRCSGGEN